MSKTRIASFDGEMENYSPKKVKNYKTRLSKDINATYCLNDILKDVSEIDFIITYHQDTEAENYILDLRAELENCKDWDRKQEIKAEIKKFDPKPEEKIAIIVDNIFAISEEKKYGLGSINGEPHFFNDCFWESVTESFMKDFLAMVAEKTGIKHFRAVKARFKDDSFFPESMWGVKQRESSLNLPDFDKFAEILARKMQNILD